MLHIGPSLSARDALHFARYGRLYTITRALIFGKGQFTALKPAATATR